MASEAQLALDPAGRLQFSRGSRDRGARGAREGGREREGRLVSSWRRRRRRRLQRRGGEGSVGSLQGRGMTDELRGECQNHKSKIGLTSSRAPIKFIYICTLPPPLKHLCLDVSKRREAPIYLARRAPTEDAEPGTVYPPLTRRPSSHPPPLMPPLKGSFH